MNGDFHCTVLYCLLPPSVSINIIDLHLQAPDFVRGSAASLSRNTGATRDVQEPRGQIPSLAPRQYGREYCRLLLELGGYLRRGDTDGRRFGINGLLTRHAAGLSKVEFSMRLRCQVYRQLGSLIIGTLAWRNRTVGGRRQRLWLRSKGYGVQTRAARPGDWQAGCDHANVGRAISPQRFVARHNCLVAPPPVKRANWCSFYRVPPGR